MLSQKKYSIFFLSKEKKYSSFYEYFNLKIELSEKVKFLSLVSW